jgi:hypothetical protein
MPRADIDDIDPKDFEPEGDSQQADQTTASNATEGATSAEGTHTPSPDVSGEATSTQAAEATFRDTLVQSHPEFRDLDDTAILDRLVSAYAGSSQMQTRLQQEAAAARFYYDQLQRQMGAGQTQQVQQPSPQQQAAAQAAEKAKWSAPEYDPGWMQLVRRDDNGALVAVPGAAPDLPQKIMAYANWKANQEHKFWQNPHEFIRDGLSDYMRDIAREVAAENVQNYRLQQTGDALYEQNKGWILAHDKDGRPLSDPATGAPQLSQEGVQAQHIYRELLATGMNDPVRAFAIAKQIVRANLIEQMAASATPAPPPAEVQKKKNNEFLQRAARRPSTNGSRERPEFNGNPRQAVRASNFSDVALRRFAEAGFGLEDKPVG